MERRHRSVVEPHRLRAAGDRRPPTPARLAGAFCLVGLIAGLLDEAFAAGAVSTAGAAVAGVLLPAVLFDVFAAEMVGAGPAPERDRGQRLSMSWNCRSCDACLVLVDRLGLD